MSPDMLAKESPSDVVQAVCQDLLRYSPPSKALDAERPRHLQRLRKLIQFKIRERRRYWVRLKRRSTEATIPVEDQVADGKGPESLAVLREWLIEVRRGIEVLPPRQKEALRLFYLEGRAMKDVAAALGCTVPAAKMLVMRALRVLRAQLRDHDTER